MLGWVLIVRRRFSSHPHLSYRPFLITYPPSMESFSRPTPRFSSAFSRDSFRSSTYAGSISGDSLSAHYLPTKFSQPHVRKRKRKIHIPKQGGGREAFGASEARMPTEGDDDYDGVMPRQEGENKPQMAWNRFKWTLLLTNAVLSVYSLFGLIFCILTWFNIWENADIMRVGNRPELVLSTLASTMAMFTSLIGWSGILLNNRAFLALYTFLLWVTFGLLVVPGYICYKRRTFNLEGKINSQWSRELGRFGRLRIQNELSCCGYFNPFVEAAVSQTCYARASFPGCKGPYLAFQRRILAAWYATVFSLVPVHIGIIVAALLCSNNVTYRFGKGMMPKAYRLDTTSVAKIVDDYVNQLIDGGSEAGDNYSRPASRTSWSPSSSTMALTNEPSDYRNVRSPLASPTPGYFVDAGSRSRPHSRAHSRSGSANWTVHGPGGYGPGGGEYEHVVGAEPGYESQQEETSPKRK